MKNLEIKDKDFLNNKYGKQHIKYYQVYIHCIEILYFIEISKALISLSVIISINWVTWMFQKLRIKNILWLRHKLEHLFMPVHKFGEMRLMIVPQIFGLLDVFSMKCAVLNHHFKEKIWMICTNKFRGATTNLYQEYIQDNFPFSLKNA